MIACLNKYKGSPRRFNKYLRVIREKKALDCIDQLNFLISPYPKVLSKLINSAIANATNDPAIIPDNLYIKEATVGRGRFLKRVNFRGRGRVGRITKFSSNIRILLFNKKEENK